MRDEISPALVRHGCSTVDFQPGQRFVEDATVRQAPFRPFGEFGIEQAVLHADDLA
jgi:hypothetical protein